MESNPRYRTEADAAWLELWNRGPFRMQYHMATAENSMENSSPTVSPRTATPTEGVLPSAKQRAETRNTQPTRVICSNNWDAAGIPACLVP